MADQPDPHDQVVAVALAGRGQGDQLLGKSDRAGLAAAGVLADLADQQGAGSQGEQSASLAFLPTQGLATARAAVL